MVRHLDPAVTSRWLPAPAGPAALVTSELAQYAAFPITRRLPSGDLLTAYSTNTSHFGVNSRTYTRRSPDGVLWRDPALPPDQPAGYGSGPAGLATETADQGGRVYLMLARTGWVPNSQTLASVAGYARWSDDEGVTWSPLTALPGAGAKASGGWTFYPSSIEVLDGGTVILAGYGTDNRVRFLQSADRGATWSPAGELAVAGRQLQEPQLCQLADGRLVVTMRSDGISPDTSERLYMAIRDSAGVWSTPKVITYDGGGAPSLAEVAPGWIAITYRGWIDRADATRRPMRILMTGIDAAWGRGNIDVTPSQYGRFLYGSLVPDGDAWRIIYGLEGPNGATAAAAQVWSLPVAFEELT